MCRKLNSTSILHTIGKSKANSFLKSMAYPLHTLHLTFCFILGGSLCEDLELFNSFKISPRSSKSEFVCKSYARFSIGFLLLFFWTDVRQISDVRHVGHPKLVKIMVSRLSVVLTLLDGNPTAFGRPKLNGRPKLT